MSTLYLAGNDTITVFGPARVYGSAGVEAVFISEDARDVHLSPAVERADLPGRAADYQFRGAAGRVEIWQDGELVASIPAGAEVRFADGGADITVNPETGDVSLGGRILGTTAESAVIPLDPARPSDPAVNPTPTPEPDPAPDPEPDPEPKPDPTPTPDPWDDPWPWPTPTPTPTPPDDGGDDEVKNPLTIEDATNGPDGRTLTGHVDTPTTFALVDAKSGDAVDELRDLTIIGMNDDTLQIRDDQIPAKVENVENVEVVGTSMRNCFDGTGWTGLRKITVDVGYAFSVIAGDASEIVTGDDVSELSVELTDDATIVAGAIVGGVTLRGSGDATVKSENDGVVIDATNLDGTLAVSGARAEVKAQSGGDGIIDARKLGELELLENTAVTVQDATIVDALKMGSAKLTLVGKDVEVKTATTGSNIDASNLLDTLTVTGTGAVSQTVKIATADGATVILDAGTGDGSEAIEATITAKGGVTLSGDKASAVLSFADGTTDATVDASALNGLTISGNEHVSGALSVSGGDGNDHVTLDTAPGGRFRFIGGDGDDTLTLAEEMSNAAIVFQGGTGDDRLIVTNDVTLGDESKISGVERVSIAGGNVLTVDDTMFPDFGFRFTSSTGGRLEINHTQEELNLDKLRGTSNVSITGSSDRCFITLSLDGATIREMITIHTTDSEDNLTNQPAEARFTTITNFCNSFAPDTRDTLVFTGMNAVADAISLTAATFEELIEKAKEKEKADGKPDELVEGKIYCGTYTTGYDWTSFAIMKQDGDAGILAVKLLDVDLDYGNSDIFVGA